LIKKSGGGKKGTVEIFSHYFTQDLVNALEELKGLSVLIIGPRGSGKSTLINTAMTSLLHQNKKVEIAKTCAYVDQSDQCTKKLHHYNFTSFTNLPAGLKKMAKLDFLDTIGIFDGNLKEWTLKRILTGKLPDVNILERDYPEEAANIFNKSDAALDMLCQLYNHRLPKIDVVVLAVSQTIGDDQAALNDVKKSIDIVRDLGFDPVLVITHWDQVKDTSKETVSNKILNGLSLSHDFFPFGEFRTSNTRNFESDIQMLEILYKIISIAKARPHDEL